MVIILNNARRVRLKNAVKYLEMAGEIVSSVSDIENDIVDNVPENLQSSDRYDMMVSCAESLEDAYEKLSVVINIIQNACK